MKESEIYVVLATDLGYLKQTFIVIESVMHHANLEDKYHFLLLINALAKSDCENYSVIAQNKYINCVIDYMVIDDELLQMSNCHIDHITKPTYYRLLLPEILNQNKCIYLDSDIVVTGDLRELYDIDIEGYDIAGVIAPYFQNRKYEAKKEHCRLAHLPDLDQYINAGVLLMNLEQLRRKRFTQKALPLTKEYYPVQDQDIINQLCYGYIKLLDFKYNFQAVNLSKENIELINRLFSKTNILNAIRNPIVVHYNKAKKPWIFCDMPFADLWWNICKKTVFFQDFVQNGMNYLYYNAIITQQSLWKQICYSDEWYAELNRRYPVVYVYGAGKMANRVISELQKKQINIRAVLVTDLSQNETKEILGLPIIQFSSSIEKDVLILIATKVAYQQQINTLLLSQ